MAPSTLAAMAPQAADRLLPGAHLGGPARGASRYGPATPSIHILAFRPGARAVEYWITLGPAPS